MSNHTTTTRPPHAPAASFWSRRLGRFDVTGVFWQRFLLWAVTHMPRWTLAPIVHIFAALFFLAPMRRIRAAVASNLAVVLGPCGWWKRQRRIARTFWRFSWCFMERYERVGPGRAPRFRFDGLDHWNEASAKGVVLVTAHIGGWEAGSEMPVSEQSRIVHVVREHEMDSRAQKLQEQMLGDRVAGYVTHFADDGDGLGLGLDLLRALRSGAVVALQGDRPREGGRTEDVELFGCKTPFPVGPVALARAAHVPLLPVFVFRTGRYAYRIVIRPPVDSVAGVAAEVEWAIRQEPHQWFCWRQLWNVTQAPSCPPGDHAHLLPDDETEQRQLRAFARRQRRRSGDVQQDQDDLRRQLGNERPQPPGHVQTAARCP